MADDFVVVDSVLESKINFFGQKEEVVNIIEYLYEFYFKHLDTIKILNLNKSGLTQECVNNKKKEVRKYFLITTNQNSQQGRHYEEIYFILLCFFDGSIFLSNKQINTYSEELFNRMTYLYILFINNNEFDKNIEKYNTTELINLKKAEMFQTFHDAVCQTNELISIHYIRTDIKDIVDESIITHTWNVPISYDKYKIDKQNIEQKQGSSCTVCTKYIKYKTKYLKL